MELYKPSPLTLTLLGSSLKNFESLHTEYSNSNTLTNEVGTQATLYEDIGFKPFMVTIYDTKGHASTHSSYQGFISTFMTRLSLYKGTYTLLPVEDNESISINNPCRVVIHVSTKPEEWKEVRIVIQDSKKDIPVIYDVTSPTHLSIKDGIIDSYDGFYNPSLY